MFRNSELILSPIVHVTEKKSPVFFFKQGELYPGKCRNESQTLYILKLEASFQHKCERSCDDFVVPSGSCGFACDYSLNFEKVIGLRCDFNTC